MIDGRRFFTLALGLSLIVCLGDEWPTFAAGPLEAVPAPSAVQVLTLEQCLQLALQKQPSVNAQRASLAASEDGYRALELLRLPAILAPELPTRRLQASLGVTAASAALDLAERETIYAVTRSYFTVLYARQQEGVARTVVDRLGATNKAASEQLDAGARDVTSADVDRSSIYLDLAEVKRIQAAQGVERALAALREAIGVGPECCLQVPAGPLPEPTARPCRQEIVAAALARRGDIIQAGVFADLTCLEIQAQRTNLHYKFETFAIGADIHSRQVPQEDTSRDYRPGGVPPEMPAMLAGTQTERIHHAHSLNARAVAVVEKTRNLIVLDAEDAFLRWEEASLKAVRTKRASETGDHLASGLSKDFAAQLKVKTEDVINAQVLTAQARSQHIEVIYQQILALIDLERITAGAFCAGLSQAVQTVAPRTDDKKDANKKEADEPRQTGGLSRSRYIEVQR